MVVLVVNDNENEFVKLSFAGTRKQVDVAMNYILEERLPTIDEYRKLRKEAGLSPKSAEAARRGLPHTLYGIVVESEEGEAVGMGRVVGDGGCFYQVVDIAVLPAHQGNGLGRRIIRRTLRYLNEAGPDTAYVCLIADIPEFYEKFGFVRCAPEGEGMYLRL